MLNQRTKVDLLIRVLLTATSILLVVDGAYACSCARHPSNSTPWSRVAAAAAGADAVFEGRVLAVATGIAVTDDEEDDVWHRRYFTFEVSHQFRGIVESKTVISTGLGGGDCGFEFEIGEIYLVYADQGEDHLETSICDRTRQIKAAGTDLRYLRGEQPLTSDLVGDTQDSLQPTVPGGNLCGTVTDSDKRPVTDAEIRLWKFSESGRREEEDEEQPHENGTYCFKNLAPGRYLISAVEEVAEPNDSDEGMPEFFRYAPRAGAYGALRKPASIELLGGEELNGLDFILEDLPGFTVKGRVAIAAGMPQADLYLYLRSSSGELFRHSQMLRLRPGSEFILESAPAGSYSLGIIFFDRVWREWMAPEIQIELKQNQDDIRISLERKPRR